MFRIFIDGSSGTTGLRIHERLQSDPDLELLQLPEASRKDPLARAECMNAADVVFFCLPDDAAREAVSLVANPHTAIIDTSTAHRTDPAWVYGFPEVCGLRSEISGAKRIANPGCHASGFIALVAPLVHSGLLQPDVQLSCFSLTGYSGGGKKMIADYEANPEARLAPRMYGLNQSHKHLPEMAKLCGLQKSPLFCPVVSSYYSGMEVVVELDAAQLQGSREDICRLYAAYYPTRIVRFKENADENGFLSAAVLSGTDRMELSVYGNDERILLVSRFDNLGKGASGAAIQNMNLLLGRSEESGLKLD